MRPGKPSVALMALVAALAGPLPACKKADPGGARPSGSAAPSASASAEMPPPPTARRTTSGEIALGNLNGQIRVSEERAAAPDPDGKRRGQLVDLLSLRADVAGRLADLERAAEIAEALPADVPGKPEPLLARAATRAALHRFDDAWADLDEAERLGAPASRTRGKRASILAARGRLDEALALAEEARKARPRVDTIGLVAALLGELGRRDESAAAFRAAFEAIDDTSPFPVAWLFFREGEMWEREGRKDLALAYYQAALARLPAYAHAAAHAARLLPPDRAEALLNTVTSTSDDPDIDAVLAEKAKERGDAAAAQAHAAKAAARYEGLVARHPAAFADHAAQFWLDAGGDPKKALDLARLNLTARRTPRAYELAVLAALSAGDRGSACALGTEGAALPRASSMFREIVKGACEPR